jgi:hypothetical protein
VYQTGADGELFKQGTLESDDQYFLEIKDWLEQSRRFWSDADSSIAIPLTIYQAEELALWLTEAEIILVLGDRLFVNTQDDFPLPMDSGNN